MLYAEARRIPGGDIRANICYLDSSNTQFVSTGRWVLQEVCLADAGCSVSLVSSASGVTCFSSDVT